MRRSSVFALLAAAFLLGACGGASDPEASPAATAGAGAGEAEAGEGTLEWAVAGGWRLDAVKARDAWRHPVETLTFFGLKPTDTVVEIFPGGGWYTAILGPYLRVGGGKLYAAHPDPAASGYARATVETFREAFVSKPGVYGDIEVTVASRDSPGIAPDGSADLVLTFRNVHNWMAGGYADKVFADAFRALKPGGVLGVVEHRLPSTRDQDLLASSGYVHEAYVIQLAQKAGFVFEEGSEINANPRDNADHPLGVWMLPPQMLAPEPGTPEAEDYNPEIYRAIGESDRMTLRFRKPAGEAAAEPAGPQEDPPPG